MVVIEKPNNIDLKTVGCIMVYDSKYILFYRAKDKKWSSLSGKIESDEKNYEAIFRELDEEINFIKENPNFFQTTYHKYGSKNISYDIFEIKFNYNPLSSFKLKKDELLKVDLFSLDEALKLDLFEDEDFCLKKYHEERMK